MAKFRGDRPKELGDYALKKKEKHHEHFISPPVTTVNGRPKNAFGGRALPGPTGGAYSVKRSPRSPSWVKGERKGRGVGKGKGQGRPDQAPTQNASVKSSEGQK